jgi:hypothetical protein
MRTGPVTDREVAKYLTVQRLKASRAAQRLTRTQSVVTDSTGSSTPQAALSATPLRQEVRHPAAASRPQHIIWCPVPSRFTEEAARPATQLQVAQCPVTQSNTWRDVPSSHTSMPQAASPTQLEVVQHPVTQYGVGRVRSNVPQATLVQHPVIQYGVWRDIPGPPKRSRLD